jgi:23S rRNA pseudouridine2605 synthase
VLAEGKKREIRRMLAKLGHKVMSLTRVAIGPVVLKGLPPGEHRSLSRSEIDLLRKVAAGIAVAPPRFHDQGESGSHRPARGPKRQDQRPESTEGRGPRQDARGRPPGVRARGQAAGERAGPRAPGGRRPVEGGDGPRSDRASHAHPPGPPRSPGKPIPGKPLSPGKPLVGKPSPDKPLLGKPIPGKPVQAGPSGAGVRGPKNRPSSLPGRKPTSGERPAPPPPSERKARAGKGPDSEARPGRRIIGLDPKIAAEAGLALSGRPSRKRPEIRRRPPRRASGVKRSVEGGDEG